MADPTLFIDDLPAAETPVATHALFAAVAIEASIDKSLDYHVPGQLVPSIRVGQRVKVPLGRNNKPAHGYVVGLSPTSTYEKTKPLTTIDDPRVLLDGEMLALARWIGRYYVTPLGAVIESVLPSAVRQRIGRSHVDLVRPAKSIVELQAILEKTSAPKRRAVLARLLQIPEGESVELHHLAGEANTTPATIRKLAKIGLIEIRSVVEPPRVTTNPGPACTEFEPPALNEDQQRVMDELQPRLASGSFSINLLLGVTGSGKTEIYLRCIRDVVQRGQQAIVLVPEIALTPQTVRRFTQRFNRVAVLHSGLSQGQRHRFWQQISTREAQVIVGARSAIFAPTQNLGIVVVDEEHEASYKQDTAPRYNARDVAIKRGQLAGCPVLLGSATPSLESYERASGERPEPRGTRVEANAARLATATNAPEAPGSAGGHVPDRGLHGDQAAQTDEHRVARVDDEKSTTGGPARGTYPPAEPGAAGAPGNSSPSVSIPGPRTSHLLRLPNRVRGLAMPTVELVDLKQIARLRPGVHLLSPRLEMLLRNTLAAGHQAILLLNRRGYSNFVFCASCQEPIHCKYCDATMTYHRSAGAHARGASFEEGKHTGQLHCHYCLAVNPLPDKCPTCGKKLSLFGLGTQRVEEELTRKFPDLKYARVDSDTMRSGKDYEALLAKFAAGDVQVMLGTQMIAKGLDYPNVTLVGVISGDTALALPDFRAAERTFQLITQVAGRAGRGDAPGRVVVQTFMPDDPTIRAALRQDYDGFAQQELKHRAEIGLPPFGRIVRIIIRDQDQDKLITRADELAAALEKAIAEEGGHVQMRGPMPCPISRIAGYFRHQIVMNAKRAGSLQRVLARVRAGKSLAKSDRIAVDVDPVSLL